MKYKYSGELQSKALSFVICLSILLAGCSKQKKDIRSNEWVLRSYQKSSASSVIGAPSTSALVLKLIDNNHFTFKLESNTVTGLYNLGYRKSISFYEAVTTKICCDSYQGKEASYLLQSINEYGIAGSDLILYGKNGLVIKFTKS